MIYQGTRFLLDKNVIVFYVLAHKNCADWNSHVIKTLHNKLKDNQNKISCGGYKSLLGFLGIHSVLYQWMKFLNLVKKCVWVKLWNYVSTRWKEIFATCRRGGDKCCVSRTVSVLNLQGGSLLVLAVFAHLGRNSINSCPLRSLKCFQSQVGQFH